jgi:transposase
MTLSGMGSSLTVEGATTARIFETYVEKVLLPSLKEGQVVVMDNLSAHKPKRIREMIEQKGCELLYLPSYSPDYNPIEEAFAKIKNLLRKAAARRVPVEGEFSELRRKVPRNLCLPSINSSEIH